MKVARGNLHRIGISDSGKRYRRSSGTACVSIMMCYTNIMTEAEKTVYPRTTTFIAANGVPFTARYLFAGDAYGRTGAFTTKEPMVEFYDARYRRPESDSPLFTEYGQFVSSYYVSTLNEHSAGVGLDLQGDVPSWKLDGRTFDKFAAWFKQFGHTATDSELFRRAAEHIR
jgi:hypothetical protein